MKRSTKTRIKDKLVNITLEILEHFYNVGGFTMDAMISKSAARKIFHSNFYKTYTEVPFAKWLYRLRDQGYLSYTPGTESIEFTFKTKLKFLNQIGKQIEESPHYHFLSFDIPETEKTSRNMFRKAIKELGYIRIQQSLWVINKDVFDIVQTICYQLGVGKYIINIISQETDIDGILDKKFI